MGHNLAQQKAAKWNRLQSNESVRKRQTHIYLATDVSDAIFVKLIIIIILILEQQISMICEGSCDSEDWNNDAENSALHHKNKLHFYNISK